MGTRLRCSKGDCFIHRQDFKQLEISASVTGFTEISGTWAIVEDPDNVEETILEEIGTSGAQLISNTPIPDGSPDDVNMIATANFRCATGIKPRVFVNWLNSTNYFYVEYDYDAEVMTIYDKSDTPLANVSVPAPDAGEEASFKVCITRFGTITADFDNAVTYACASPIAGGKYAGIGNGSAVTTYWTRFTLERHYWSDPTCEFCICTCAGSCVEKELLATFVMPAASQCDSLDGVTFNLDLATFDPNTGEMTWEWDGAPAFWECGVCRADWVLICEWDPESPASFGNWRILSDTLDLCSPTGPFYVDTEASTCDPLYLVFRGQDWGEEGEPYTCCVPPSRGTITDIIITERP